MKADKTKIFLADDHHIFRNGIARLLHDEDLFVIQGDASDGIELLKKLKDKQVDVLLLDINMPNMGGLEVMPKLKAEFPNIKVLVFTSHDDEAYIKNMMKKGACGYVLKSVRKEELMRAIHTVANGDTYLSKVVSDKLISTLSDDKKNNTETPLTDREIEVLKLVAKGHINQKIGEALFISPRTVDTHRRNIMEKLNLHNAAALTHYAAQKNLID